MTKDSQVGCEHPDGLLNVHNESETCEVCMPSANPNYEVAVKGLKDVAESGANTGVVKSGVLANYASLLLQHLSPVETTRDDAAFEAGWRAAAEWAKRDDLVHDIDSPACRIDRFSRLKRLAVEPSCTCGFPNLPCGTAHRRDCALYDGSSLEPTQPSLGCCDGCKMPIGVCRCLEKAMKLAATPEKASDHSFERACDRCGKLVKTRQPVTSTVYYCSIECAE